MMQEIWDPPTSISGVPSTLNRVALLSVHTCPLDQPGMGDSGGMNVYVRSVAKRLAEMGLLVDVFTRASGVFPRIREIDPGVRVIHLEAGPDRPIPKEQLSEHLCEFLYALLRFEAAETARLGAPSPLYDALHSHYWLSGWVGRLASERWGIPLIQSFHTLGRVKNQNLVAGDRPEPPHRIAAEERIVRAADCILAPTEQEAADLIHLYGARPEQVRVVTPGVDTEIFAPDGSSEEAKRALGLSGHTVVLFAGRLQLLKSPDIAVRAVAALAAQHPDLNPALLVLGGPSGSRGLEPADLERLGRSLGIAGRVFVLPPVPHLELPRYYRAADAVLVPSRTESFGLVALEASACGTPVVATDVGGLRTAVRHGITGLLVPGAEPAAFATALARILTDSRRAEAMGAAGAVYARRFDWRRAAAGLLSVYEEQTEGFEAARNEA